MLDAEMYGRILCASGKKTGPARKAAQHLEQGETFMPNEPELEMEVDLLVNTGVVAEQDRQKTLGILRARKLLLHELSFGREANDRARHLDEAQAAWHHAATAIRQSNEVHAHLLEAIVPLRDDPRCQELFHRLEANARECAAACANLSPPSGPPGSEFMRLESESAEIIRALQAVVGR
jgi:hypothetical protein